jgi:excisionase family DNA binding protein
MLTVKELSAWLNIKESTLYLWASQNKIPCRRIHGLVRFEPEAIQAWLNGFLPCLPRKASWRSPAER